MQRRGIGTKAKMRYYNYENGDLDVLIQEQLNELKKEVKELNDQLVFKVNEE